MIIDFFANLLSDSGWNKKAPEPIQDERITTLATIIDELISRNMLPLPSGEPSKLRNAVKSVLKLPGERIKFNSHLSAWDKACDWLEANPQAQLYGTGSNSDCYSLFLKNGGVISFRVETKKD